MKNLNKIISKVIKEATSDATGSRGSYVSPLLLGLRDFGDHTNKPFIEIINDYDSALLDYDSLDGKMSTPPKSIKKIEKKAEKVTNWVKKNPDEFVWDGEAGVMNSLPKQNTDAKSIKLSRKQKPKVKLENLKNVIKNIVREATSDATGSRGSYVPPMQPGLRPWKKSSLGPFDKPVSDFKSPLVQYDSYDHKFDLRRDQIIELEKLASKIQDYIKSHPYSTFSDQDGNPVNQFMYDGKTPDYNEKLAPFIEKVPFNEWVELTDEIIAETSTSITAGLYNAPVEIGATNWKSSELAPFVNDTNKYYNKKVLLNTLRKNVKRNVGVWEKNKNGSYKKDINYPETVNEDLAVWFGKKKKPKGSSQPKGPWVDICRKVDGKHPPCGRSDTSKGSYPKCRAAGVAGKMSDSQKRSACQQKRRAEKQDTQTGKGQKPIMTSYKPKKK